MNENYEIEILEKMTIPYVVFPQDNILQKKMLARQAFSLKNEDIFFVSSVAFSYEGFVAGITIEQIEYFAKNAPVNFKKELSKSISDETFMKEVFEIAKAMDEDMGEGATQNQRRIKSVYQYITDNWAVFQF